MRIAPSVLVVMQEHRAHPRHRTLKAGTIEFNRAGGISCMIRNLSETGRASKLPARLEFPTISSWSSSPNISSAYVTWRGVSRIGSASSLSDTSLLLLGTQYLATCRVDQMAFPTRQARQRDIPLLVIFGCRIICDPALDFQAGRWTSVDESRHVEISHDPPRIS